MNQLHCMRVFTEVVDKNSFGRAAHALGMATASVSVQIRNLEEHLGVRLLYRTTRNIALTDEGERYYAHCKRVLEDIGQMESSFTSRDASLRGRIRIDAEERHICMLLVPVLPELLARYPDIHLDFIQSGHLLDVVDTGADVMLRILERPPDDANVIARPMGTTRLLCAASPSYLEDHGAPERPHDLALHDCILSMDALTGRHWEWKFERDEERVVLDVPGPVAFTQRLARIEAAVRGLGIIRDMECMIARQLASGELRPVLEDWTSLAPLTYIVYPRDRCDTPRVQAFVDFLLEKYPPDRPLKVS